MPENELESVVFLFKSSLKYLVSKKSLPLGFKNRLLSIKSDNFSIIWLRKTDYIINYFAEKIDYISRPKFHYTSCPY
jgi:hypothetical protein